MIDPDRLFPYLSSKDLPCPCCGSNSLLRASARRDKLLCCQPQCRALIHDPSLYGLHEHDDPGNPDRIHDGFCFATLSLDEPIVGACEKCLEHLIIERLAAK